MYRFIIKILRPLYIVYRKNILKSNKKIIFGKNSIFSKTTIFEGRNFISKNAELINSSIGFGSYLGADTTIMNCKIGKYTSIGPEVKCVFGNHPTNTFVSTHPAFFSTRKQAGFSFVSEQLYEEFHEPLFEKEPYSISIGHDVWIGARVIILDGVTIGDGAIIASGALINKDVQPYSIVGGVPAKEIKKRFNDSEIEFLLNLKWWYKDFDWISQHAPKFKDINTLMKILKSPTNK